MKEILHIKMAGGEFSFDLPKITLLRGKSFKNPDFFLNKENKMLYTEGY